MNTTVPVMSSAELRRARRMTVGLAGLIYLAGWAMVTFPLPFSDAGPMPPWPVMIDYLLTVPAIYAFLHRREPRRALRGALALAGFGYLLASWILPPLAGPFWDTLRGLRNLSLAIGVAIELGILFLFFRALGGLRRAENPDYALTGVVEKVFGPGFVTRILAFELRIWFMVFAPPRWKWAYRGTRHFSYHAKDANLANQQGFLVLIAAELPVAHLLVSLWSSLAAWIFTGLSLYSLAFLFAHYRATQRCPISLDDRQLYLRYGMFLSEQAIALSQIESITLHRGPVTRDSTQLRLCESGDPNVCIRLRSPQAVAGLFGRERQIEIIYLGVDQPHAFVNAVQTTLASTESVPTAAVHTAPFTS
ncbi:hypothetical protein [Tahibacter amnicola]|uniref:PH (Pleckstrin Homology) domain-containing protein n=1 Tax=Tahibacter amnicola TaxID=2976241 RepID=A0ABY6BLV2_9GAMM|nr:hypothetical protein [Tahibacter amnicola]UXI70025.1 hypothetical protein N4264_10470 [Tahibacter amnicola]